MSVADAVRLRAARDRVIEAARTWYENRGNVEAPLAEAVVELLRAERATPGITPGDG